MTGKSKEQRFKKLMVSFDEKSEPEVLVSELREALAHEFTPALREVDLVTRAENPGDEGSGWDRGMLDRTFPSLDPTEYTRRSRGGDQYPGADAGSVAPRSTELPAWLKMLKP